MGYVEERVSARAEGVSEKKSTVFLIGDSSCMGYRETVRKELSGIANVVYPEENGRCSQYVLLSLRGWSGLCDPDTVKAVQFNTGHWDVAHWNDEPVSLTPLPEYCRNMLRIADALKRLYRNAEIVFATTMPMNPNGLNSVNYRFTYEIEAYNRASTEALRENGVRINDLFALAKDFPASYFADYCHLTDEANALVGKHCAKVLGELLKQP